MKKILLFILFIACYFLAEAQVISINPNSTYRGHTLRTYITCATGVITTGTAPMNYNDIYLQKGATIIYADPSYNSSQNYYFGTDSLYADFTISPNAPLGYYDVHVVSYTLALTPVYNLLTNGFLIKDYAGTIEGQVYYDMNQNGNRDLGDYGLSNQQVLLNPQGSRAFTDANGHYKFYTDIGNFSISYLPKTGYIQTSLPLNYNLTIPPSDTAADFGAYINPSLLYSQNFSVWKSRLRCNATGYSSVKFCNNGFATEKGGITLVHSANLPVIYTNLPYDYINGDTMHWSYSGLNPSQCIQIEVRFQNPAAGQTIWYTFIDSVLDASGVLRNVYKDSYDFVVTCSIDPNDKAASPEGVEIQHYTLMNSDLTYTINFQNTGNDSAVTINLYDTLDSHLDLNTFDVLASSHTMSTQIASGGAVRFTFENIFLADSNIDEPHSHGWVIYKIKPKSGLPDPTVIYNKAYIVFDFNAPIITNSTFNTFVTVIPMGLSENVLTKKMILYPNPSDGNMYMIFKDVEKKRYEMIGHDILGRTVDKRTLFSEGDVKLSFHLPAGIYSYQITDCSGSLKTFTGKFVIN